MHNANAVLRTHTTELDIAGLQDVTVKEHYVITILNAKGDKLADRNEDYSKFKSIESINGCVYDANGDKVKKIKQSDFKDFPLYANAGAYSDVKIKAYQVSYRKYPYTVEYTIETRQNQTFGLPCWSPQKNIECAIEEASFTVTTHNNTALRYKQFFVPGSPAISGDEPKEYRWKIAGVSAHRNEPMSFNGSFGTPTILLATEDFMLEDHKGSMASWNDFGKFIYELNKGRDVLPQDLKTKVRESVAGITDDHQKVRALYAYLQKTMRYVALEYGIGGWQTLDADYLARNQYGDCKALSNYMMSMLSEAGIKSYPVLIKAGIENEQRLERDFVCNQFNHEILLVPFVNDTMWLECTSTELPANYLSDFTQNREALIITPQGGQLVRTPVYDTATNMVFHHAGISINVDGSLAVDMCNQYYGEPALHINHMMNENDHDKEQYLHSKFHLASFNIDSYKFERTDRGTVISGEELTKLTINGLLTRTGSRCFILPDVYPLKLSDPTESGQRKTPFYIPESEAITDTFEIIVPGNFDVEFVPGPVSMFNTFGSYCCRITKNENKLLLVRKFVLNSGIYDAALFEKYAVLITLANNESGKKIVFKSKS